MISTAFVESLVNSFLSKCFVKKQPMQWTKPGAHVLLQTHAKVVSDELETAFRKWYPDFRLERKAASAPGFLWSPGRWPTGMRIGIRLCGADDGTTDHAGNRALRRFQV